MLWTQGLIALREVLADLYPSEDDARVLLATAIVNDRLINFGGSAINLWTNILKYVSNNEQVRDLVQAALSDYPGNSRLREAWQKWSAEQQPEFLPLNSRAQPPIDFPTLASLPPGAWPDPAQAAMMSEPFMTAPTGLTMHLTETQVLSPTQALPTMEALFEVIHDPAEVPAAIFRTQPSRGLAPYDVPYVEGREGIADVQDAIENALMDAGGMVLVLSRAGLGKTREVAELATRLCDEGWVVGVAKKEGDDVLNRLASMPDSLRSKRLLLVFDDLHSRVLAGVAQQTPYAERLEALLAYLEAQLGPRDMRVLATARSESDRRQQLGYDPVLSPWRRFGVFDLPEFTTDGLVDMLVSLASQAKVAILNGDAEWMVKNSDHRPITLTLNIERSLRHEKTLTRENWLNSQGRSWKALFREARHLYPTAPQVFKALHLLRQAGLPTRVAYIAHLSKSLAGTDTAAAVDGLIDLGLLGLRRGVLDAYIDEQLVESLHGTK